MRILLLFAHPALEKSRVNRRLIREVQAMAGVTFHDLYEAYPDFEIDADREQALLTAHDLIVMQHPLYWYTGPPLVNQWKIAVLAYGWAYGKGGGALRGKTWLSAITTGGSDAAYQRDGLNRFTIRELLTPLEQAVHLCGMDFLPPFVVHNTLRITPAEIEGAASDYRRALEALRDGRLDREAARAQPRLNSNLDRLLPR